MYKLFEAHDLEANLDIGLRNEIDDLCKHLNFDNWKIILFTKDKLYGYVQYSSDTSSEEIEDVKKNVCFERLKGKSYLDLILNEKKIILSINRSNTCSAFSPLTKSALTELYFPLFSAFISNEDVFGCLYFSRTTFPENEVYEALESKYVISKVKNIERSLNLDYLEYIDDVKFVNLMHILSEITRAKEPFMKSHLYNVAYLCNMMGEQLNFSAEQLYRLYMAAILHDVGKLYISESILNKKEELTEIEKYEIRKHPIHSYNIVKDLIIGNYSLKGIDEIVLQHHERYDGTGYPYGLKGDDILLESRILALADSVDAMLSERSYKKPISLNNVINQLYNCKGTQFDPILAQMMINILMNKQRNQEVVLSKPIVVGTIVLSTKEASYQVRGTLAKTRIGYMFKKDCDDIIDPNKIHIADIIEATFHTEVNKVIYEYDVNIKYLENSKIYISGLNPRILSNYFSLLWELSGKLTFKNDIFTRVTINKIGGDFLSFYVDKNHFKDEKILDNANTMTIRFDDCTEIVVAGKIVKTIKIGHKLHCDFKYLNILESTRDQIFKQLFKKQTEFRKSIFSAMMN